MHAENLVRGSDQQSCSPGATADAAVAPELPERSHGRGYRAATPSFGEKSECPAAPGQMLRRGCVTRQRAGEGDFTLPGAAPASALKSAAIDDRDEPRLSAISANAVSRLIFALAHRMTPSIARCRSGCGCTRNRRSQSAAVPTVPGSASARSTPDRQGRGRFTVTALQVAQAAGEPLAEKSADR